MPLVIRGSAAISSQSLSININPQEVSMVVSMVGTPARHSGTNYIKSTRDCLKPVFRRDRSFEKCARVMGQEFRDGCAASWLSAREGRSLREKSRVGQPSGGRLRAHNQGLWISWIAI